MKKSLSRSYLMVSKKSFGFIKSVLSVLFLMLLFIPVNLTGQCTPASAVVYTGGVMSAGVTYKISDDTHQLPDLIPAGVTLYVVGNVGSTNAFNRIREIASSGQVHVCDGGSISISPKNQASVSFNNLTVGPHGAVVFSLGVNHNLGVPFFVGKLNENAVVSVCANNYSTNNSTWTNYIGNTAGKSYVVIDGTINTSSSVVSNKNNVTLIDYGTYSHSGAIPLPPTGGQKITLDGHKDNPFTKSIACNPKKLLDALPAPAPAPAPTGIITGKVTEDITGDAIGEIGIANVTITLKDHATGVAEDTTTTDANGNYSFNSLVSKAYLVEETDLPGYISVTPNSVVVNLSTATSGIANFVDRSTSLKCSPVGNTGSGKDSTLAISTLDRGGDTKWLDNIKNGQLVLDSKQKGLVIPNISSESIITNPVEGMIFFDTTARCIKLYQNSKWGCVKLANCIKDKP